MLDPWFKHRYPLKHLKKSLYWAVGDYWVLRDARAVLFTAEEERLRAASRSRCTSAANRSRRLARRRHRRTAAMRAAFTRVSGDSGAPQPAVPRPDPRKEGCDLLVQAFASVAATDRSLHLIMAGPATCRCGISWRHCASGVADRITWTGMLQGDLKWGAFETAEAFCLPSHQENFGVAVAESLGCGVPVLISNKVNIWREIEADGAGMICDDTAADTERVLRQWIATTRRTQPHAPARTGLL
jgi:hypothetical protein